MGELGLAWGGGVGAGVGGGGPFSRSTNFNYFRHNKSEPELIEDFIFAMF